MVHVNKIHICIQLQLNVTNHWLSKVLNLKHKYLCLSIYTNK